MFAAERAPVSGDGASDRRQPSERHHGQTVPRTTLKYGGHANLSVLCCTQDTGHHRYEVMEALLLVHGGGVVVHITERESQCDDEAVDVRAGGSCDAALQENPGRSYCS